MKDGGGEPAPKRIKLEQQPVPTAAKSISSFSTMTFGTSDAGSKEAQDLKGGVGKGNPYFHCDEISLTGG